MKQSFLSSLSLVWKLSFLLAGLALFSALYFFSHSDSTANILDENLEKKLVSALEENDESFLSSFFSEKNNEEESVKSEKYQEMMFLLTEKFEHKMDIEVLQRNEFLFFSFLGIEKNSTVLHPVFGNWNNDTQKLTVFPQFSVSVMENKERNGVHEIVFTNSSAFAFPVTEQLLLLPYEKEGYSPFSESLLLPGDSFSFVADSFIPQKLSHIESIQYGFSVKIY